MSNNTYIIFTVNSKTISLKETLHYYVATVLPLLDEILLSLT